MNLKINVLGTEYEIKYKLMSEDETLEENRWGGYCERLNNEIVILSSEDPYYTGLSKEEKHAVRNETLRHEILHAFLNESGLSDNANQFEGAWCKNEEMIDWFAIQFPKILKIFKEVDCV
ncbi:MAG: hypothetical protein SOY97_05995 [Candidatus Metalachnospira sp.]|nr:hypothetical protein [Candidatus Metalachnospira sp.]